MKQSRTVVLKMKKNKKNNISEEDFFSKLDNVEKKATSDEKTIKKAVIEMAVFKIVFFVLLIFVSS